VDAITRESPVARAGYFLWSGLLLLWLVLWHPVSFSRLNQRVVHPACPLDTLDTLDTLNMYRM